MYIPAEMQILFLATSGPSSGGAGVAAPHISYNTNTNPGTSVIATSGIPVGTVTIR